MTVTRQPDGSAIDAARRRAATRIPIPCSHPPRVARTTFGKVDGGSLAHAACARCGHDWWEMDRQPIPFGAVERVLAAHYARRR